MNKNILAIGIIILFIGAGVASPVQLKNDNISKNYKLPLISFNPLIIGEKEYEPRYGKRKSVY